MKTAIRKTSQGYILAEICIEQTNFGGIRKFCNKTSLIYKRQAFAEQKCKQFYARVYKNPIYYGVIGENEFIGEPATEADMLAFNSN